MSTRLDQALTDYLALRRAMGFHLDRAQKLLTQFIRWLDEQGIDTITTACAMDWATLPADAAAWWWQLRMSAVRGFATYLHARDPRVEIPPPGLIQGRTSPGNTVSVFRDRRHWTAHRRRAAAAPAGRRNLPGADRPARGHRHAHRRSNQPGPRRPRH
jgi:hypothetical protein